MVVMNTGACSTKPVLTRKTDLTDVPPERRIFIRHREKGLTVEKAGAKAGVSPRTAWYWERWRLERLENRGK